MPEYKRGTVLRDNDGDLWRVSNRGNAYRINEQGHRLGAKFYRRLRIIESEWGPLVAETQDSGEEPKVAETRVEYLCLGHPAWPGGILGMPSFDRAETWFNEHRDTHPVFVIQRLTSDVTMLDARPVPKTQDYGQGGDRG